MQQTQLTTGEYLKALKVIHIGLTAGVVLFLLIAVVLQLTGFEPELKELEMVLLGITGFAAVSGIFAGNLIFRKKLEQLADLKNLNEKLTGYQSALIVKYALVEGPAFFTIVAYLLTANILFPVITVFLVFVLFLSAPRKEKLISELNLSLTETNVLNKPDALIQ
jgi:thiosulfate reductase cytochrome b subunit